MIKHIAIDLVPIRVGEGGTGSGIWTYARELLYAMDKEDFQDLEILCLVNEGQVPFFSKLRKLRFVVFPCGGKSIIKRLWWVHVQLPFLCLRKKVDVLHKLATETPLFCPAKRVTTIHDFYYEFLLENHPSQSIRLYERLENLYFSFVTKICFRKSKGVIAVSEATKQEVIQRFSFAADRIHVIHHGAPVAQLLAKSQLLSANSTSIPLQTVSSKPHTSNSKSDAFRILCVAKFMEHKGQHLLIEAFEVLLTEHPALVGSVRLDLRGFHNDEDYFAGIQSQIRSSRFKDSIRILPFNPDEGLSEIYRDVDLVVLLSRYEGFGLPVLEAQGMGVPVLCSDLPVLQEVGGDGAVYVDRENMELLASSLFEFITDLNYRKKMAARAHENMQRFSWVKAAQETLNVYRLL